MQNSDNPSSTHPMHDLKERFLVNAFLTNLLVEKLGIKFDPEEGERNPDPQLSEYFHAVTKLFNEDLNDLDKIKSKIVENAWDATTADNIEDGVNEKANRLIQLAMGCYLDSVAAVCMNKDNLDFTALQNDLDATREKASRLAKLEDQQADGNDLPDELTAMVERINEHVDGSDYIDTDLLDALSAISPIINNITNESASHGIENTI